MMSDERERILRMVREGKITAEEGDELLAALEEGGENDAEVPREEKADIRPPTPTQPEPPLKFEIPPSRSVGVMIAGFVLILLSLAWLSREPTFLFPPHRWVTIVQPFRMNAGYIFGGFPLYSSFYSILTFLIVIPAVGVLFFKEWARKFLLILLVIHALLALSIFMLEGIRYIGFGIPHFTFKGIFSSRSILLWILTDVFFIWYFCRAKIRPQFS